ncbi:MAG: DUF6794 domain-containing protein [Phycisphaerales bacterium]|jgi:hypothetical protein
MRIALALGVLLSFSIVSAQEAGQRSSQPDPNIPTTLTEAHAALERMLSRKTLAEIDAMASEDGMARYHFSLGLSMRNEWGLWHDSPLAKHMQGLGFTHPDDMSSVILETFWCKRHGKPLRLEERAAATRNRTDAAQKTEEEKKKRVQQSVAAIGKMMMGLRFEARDVPVVQMPIPSSMTVRFMCPFRDGVFLTAYCQGSISSHQYVATDGYYTDPNTGERRKRPDMDDSVRRGFCSENGQPRKMKPGEDVFTLGFYFNQAERKIHRICVPEVGEVYSAVVVGGRAWFAGMTNGKTTLVGVGERDRVTASLPQDDEIPDLGMDGDCLLAVYSKSIHRLEGRTWKLVYSGDILLPRSCLPPQRHGDRVLLRDEGIGEEGKRFWWLETGDKPHLRLLACDTRLFEPVVQESLPKVRRQIVHDIAPYDWEDASSYCVTSDDSLWACVAGGSFLLRRSPEGNYSFAIAYNSIQFGENRPDSEPATPRLSVSGITALPDGGLLLVGRTGLYRLKGDELTQELAFVRQTAARSSARAGADRWTPSHVLSLDDRSYVIGATMWDGVYLLHKGDDGQWSCLSVENARDTVIW